MKIIDHSPYPSTPGWMSMRDRILGTLKFGFSWYAEVDAQAKAVEILRKQLDNKFTLIRNLALPNLEIPIPLFLIGPHGAQAIHVTPLKGIYRAKGDAWSVVDSRRQYRPAKPNLVTATGWMAKAAQDFLNGRGYSYPQIEAVLLCTDPGIHVETVRPIVRVVLSDAIDRFAGSLRQANITLSTHEIDEITDLLVNPQAAAGERGLYDSVSTASQKPSGLAQSPVVQKLRTDLTRQQLIILGILAVLFILVLIGLIVLALRFA